MSDTIQGLHHITFCTATAQGDVDFFMKTLGLRLIKQTLLYDGVEPIIHLYFSDKQGSAGSISTAFAMRRTGVKGRPGSGQIGTCSYAVLPGSLRFWNAHLARHDVPVLGIGERFGQKFLTFRHPDCALEFEMVEDANDTREPWVSPYVPGEYAIRGFHSWTVGVRDAEDMDAFMKQAWNFTPMASEGDYTRYKTGDGGPAKLIDLKSTPDLRAGSWTLGEGTTHHGAFAVASLAVQDQLKAHVEGLGFTDFSDRKNRGYFESIYVRTPSGALFEATHSIGFTVDEDEEKLGTELIISPQFADQKAAIIARMNDPIVI